MGCTYCVIPKAIGPLRNSKSVEAIIEEMHQGIENGYQRIRLIGDSAGSYGLDIRTNLGVLLNRISQIKGSFTLELTDINPVFLPVIFEPVKDLCAQKRLSSLYIPIQSGNARILSLMRRRSDVTKTKQMLYEIKQTGSRGFKLGTSVIVGFPSETMEELRDTINICNEVAFDWIWCHGFSVRPGTLASTFSGQLSADDINERVNLFKNSIQRKGRVVLDSQ
jgi:tRNA-2-methylthio-N6-dimethylallyladenosine synthase